jgi:hypothetical protein
VLTTATRKRQSFDFEREFRIVFWDDTCAKSQHGLKELPHVVVPDGREFPCDLATLINEIYVSPRSEGWFLGNGRKGAILRIHRSSD